MPEPPVCSMVSVYSTTLPHRSATVRLVVWMFSVSVAPSACGVAGVAQSPSYDVTSPAVDRLGSNAVRGSIGQARSAANLSESSVASGTST